VPERGNNTPANKYGAEILTSGGEGLGSLVLSKPWNSKNLERIEGMPSRRLNHQAQKEVYGLPREICVKKTWEDVIRGGATKDRVH